MASADFAWSHQQPNSKHKSVPNALVNGACLVLLVVVLHIEVSYDLLGSSNGRVVSFLKSLHMTNYYWPRSRYTSRSMLGCMVLKFAGSSIISVALGEGLLIASPRHILSFLWAFSLVRSDSVEAIQVARHMRHSLAFNVLLNLVAGLYKFRKLVFLAGASPALGVSCTVLVGTFAFTASTILMALEAAVLSWAQARAAGASRAPFSARPPAIVSKAGAVQPPNVRSGLRRNFGMLCVLLLGQRSGDAPFAAAKVGVLLYLCYYYNKGATQLRVRSLALGRNPSPRSRRARGRRFVAHCARERRCLRPPLRAGCRRRDACGARAMA